MAGSARRIVIEFLGKDKSLGRTAGDLENSTGRLGARMKKVGLIAAAGLGAGAVLAAKGLYSMGKAAAEDQVSTALLAKQLKSSAGATKGQIAQTERWITAQGKAFGVADDDLRPALAKLARATGSVSKAQKLASLAMDVSAGTGKDLGAVSQALAKAQTGNVAGLARLGIATKNADGKTKSLAEVTKDLGKQFGGAAATKADTLQGKMGRLKLMLSETEESIGYKLIPVVTKMADWFLKTAVPAISKFSSELRSKLGPVIQWVRDLFSSSTSGMAGDTSKNLAAIKSTFMSFVSIVTSLWNRFGGILTSLASSYLRNILKIIGGALQIISGVFKVFAALLHGDWAGVWAGLKQILTGFWTAIKAIISLQWALVKAQFKIAGAALRGIFGGIWSGMKSLARAGAQGILNAIKSIPGAIRGYAGLWKSAGAYLIKGFVNGMKNAAGIISGIAGNVWSGVKGLLNRAIDKINSHLKIHINKGPIHINFSAGIPHLAKGAIVKRRPGGILANIGEGRYDEGVFPLDKNGLPRGMSVAGGDGGGDGGTVVVQLVLDGKVIHESLLKRKRTLRRGLGLETVTV